MKNRGPINFYLSIKVDRDRTKRTFKITQTAAIDQILEKMGLTDCTPAKIPMENGLQLQSAANDSELIRLNSYIRIVGKLLHLSINTRPDIAHPVSKLAQWNAKPNQACWVVFKKIRRYLKDTRTMGITYGARENPDITDNDISFVKVYSDADWAGNTFTNRLISGYIFLAAGGPIIWGLNKQISVAFFTCEAEYVAAHSAAREVTWIRFLLHEIGLSEAITTSLPSKDTT